MAKAKKGKIKKSQKVEEVEAQVQEEIQLAVSSPFRRKGRGDGGLRRLGRKIYVR